MKNCLELSDIFQEDSLEEKLLKLAKKVQKIRKESEDDHPANQGRCLQAAHEVDGSEALLIEDACTVTPITFFEYFLGNRSFFPNLFKFE